jgi:hypothetical protein
MQRAASFLHNLIFVATVVILGFAISSFMRFLYTYGLAALLWPSLSVAQSGVDVSWHAPNKTWINDLNQVINGSGVHGFVFNGSSLPNGLKYGAYNWCNMPHVRKQEYPKPSDDYELQYVELVRMEFLRLADTE